MVLLIGWHIIFFFRCIAIVGHGIARRAAPFFLLRCTRIVGRGSDHLSDSTFFFRSVLCLK